MQQRVREKVVHILETHQPEPIAPERKQAAVNILECAEQRHAYQDAVELT